MDAVHVDDDRHSAMGRRIGAALELVAVVVGGLSLAGLVLYVEATLTIGVGADALIVAWVGILAAGVLMGLLGALSFLWRDQAHLIGALAVAMAIAEFIANLVHADFDLALMFRGYPEALLGHFGNWSMIAAWRFPLTVMIVLLYLLWLRDRPRRGVTAVGRAA